LLLSCIPGVIPGICPYSVCIDLHSPTSPALYAGCNSRYLSLFCMYGSCTVPLLLSCIPGVILGICPYSVCMDPAQSYLSCPVCRV
ncbi:unnamed protein product, partial [Staurois parvus]